MKIMESIRKRKNQKGFTLIELVVAVAIMLLLGAAVTPMLLSHLKDAKVAAVNETLINAKTAFDSYFVKNQGVLTDSDTDSDYLDEMVSENFLPVAPSIAGAGALTVTLDSSNANYDEYAIEAGSVEDGVCSILKTLDGQIDDDDLTTGNFKVTDADDATGATACGQNTTTADDGDLWYLLSRVNK